MRNYNEWLDFNRLWLLLKREILSSWRPVLLAFGVTTAVLVTLFTYLGILGQGQMWESSDHLFHPILVIAGLILSSRAFRELTSHESRIAYLTLPVSNLERLVSALLITGPIFALGWLAFYTLMILALTTLGLLIWDIPFHPFQPFTAEVFTDIGKYLVIHSVFVTGSVYFRKHAFLKTMLRIFAFFAISGILSMIITSIYFSSTAKQFDHYELEFQGSLMQLFKPYIPYFKTLIILIMPTFWWISYRKLRKLEVK